jgi:hypothetical protein
MPQITPLLTLTLIHTWYEESPPPGVFNELLSAPNNYRQFWGVVVLAVMG